MCVAEYFTEKNVHEKGKARHHNPDPNENFQTPSKTKSMENLHEKTSKNTQKQDFEVRKRNRETVNKKNPKHKRKDSNTSRFFRES